MASFSLTDAVPNPIKYKKRNVSAVRSFPPKCGINAEPITPEALQNVMVLCIDDYVAPAAAQDNSVPHGNDTLASLLKEIPVADKAFQTSKDKPSRRKVHVRRDFPPNCGKNGPPLTEEERAKIFLETEALTGSKTEYLQTVLQSSKEAALASRKRRRRTSSIEVEAAGGSVKATQKATVNSEDSKTVRKVVEVSSKVRYNACLEDGKTELKVDKKKRDWRKSRVVAKKRIPITYQKRE